jgi:GT2 family glycosyltransferase
VNPQTPIPTVSVVMATTGRPRNIEALVPEVLADPGVRHFVVVVDGDDPASIGALERLATHFDRLVYEQAPRSGQLRALELGMQRTDAEVVLLLDDDVYPSPGLATAHARRHATERGLVLAGPMPVQLPERGADIGSRLYARDYLQQVRRIEAGQSTVLDSLWLGNVSMRRADALAVGLYSANFTASYHADQDFGMRLAAAGLVGKFDPTLEAFHRHERDNRAFLRDARRRGAGLRHLHAVHRRLGPFDPSVFTRDLPYLVAVAVRLAGATRLGPLAARATLAASEGAGVLHWDSARVVLAKLARRVMLVRGTVAGEGSWSATASPIIFAGAHRHRVDANATTTSSCSSAIPAIRRPPSGCLAFEQGPDYTRIVAARSG